ncbi:MAG: M16 family metallopeptidase [Acidobacteriota bacterium]
MKPSMLIAAALILTTIAAWGKPVMKTDNAVLLPVKNDPTVSFRLWFKVGSQDDPKGKEGLAAITASMMTDAATKTHSYEEILDRLFPLAASYDASVSVEQTVVYGRTHKDNLKEFYPLLMDAVTKPAFRQEDLDRIKSQTLNYLENTLRYASDEELGKAVLYTTIFDGTPYGHISSGTIEAVKSITLDDVKKFYAEHFTRGNVVIGLGGGYAPSLLAAIRRDIAALPAGAPAPTPKPEPKKTEGTAVTIVEKDAASTAISIGFPIDVVRGQKDWYALAVANSWLGEHRNSSSHLYQVIREARGLNYGDYSYIENFPNGGRLQMPPQNVARRSQIFEIWIRPVPNETRQFALRAALREFDRLANNGMSASQFEQTRAFLKKYTLHYAPTTMERLGYAIDDRFYGIKGSHLELFRTMLGTLSVGDVNAAMKKYWRPSGMQIAIVTKDAAALKRALIENNQSPIRYETPKPESVLKEDFEISTYSIPVLPDNVKIVPVNELFVR